MQILLALLLIAPCSLLAQPWLEAPNKEASPINQRRAYGNACGPASLLNAFQYGSQKWKKVFDSVPGTNSRSRIRYVVAAWGNKPSFHVKGTKRWNQKAGINLLDLTDMANEMRQSYFLPKIKNKVLTRKTNESRAQLLQRSHKLMVKSMQKGLPPIISIRRYAHRYSKEVGSKSWWPIRAHFVVITGLPAKLDSDTTHFPVTYVDPYGGFTRKGHIRIHPGAFSNSPFLTADFPSAQVGKSFVKKTEITTVALTAIIGRW